MTLRVALSSWKKEFKCLGHFARKDQTPSLLKHHQGQRKLNCWENEEEKRKKGRLQLWEVRWPVQHLGSISSGVLNRTKTLNIQLCAEKRKLQMSMLLSTICFGEWERKERGRHGIRLLLDPWSPCLGLSFRGNCYGFVTSTYNKGVAEQ